MKTKTFKQIIQRLVDKGVDSIKITRSDFYCGCIKPNDIIGIEVQKGNSIYFVSVSHVFDEIPVIDIDCIIRDNNGRCINRYTVGQFKYSI